MIIIVFKVLIITVIIKIIITLRMSQISWSVIINTFMADLMSENSAASSLPSHTVLPPCKRKRDNECLKT